MCIFWKSGNAFYHLDTLIIHYFSDYSYSIFMKIFSVISFIALFSTSLVAAVSELIPLDYEAPDIGTDLATLYLYEKQYSGPYYHGGENPSGDINAFISALQFTTTVDMSGYTVCPFIVFSYASATASKGEMSDTVGHHAIGMGDVIVGATSWLINNRNANRYLSATLLAYLPSGDYNPDQLLNIGENRYKGTLTIAYIDKIAERWFIELAPEYALYGKNNNFMGQTYKESPTYALSSNIRYNLNEQTALYAGYQKNWGGESILDGVHQNDSLSTERAATGVYYYTLGGTQILLRYAKEFNVQNGLKATDDILLRFQWGF